MRTPLRNPARQRVNYILLYALVALCLLSTRVVACVEASVLLAGSRSGCCIMWLGLLIIRLRPAVHPPSHYPPSDVAAPHAPDGCARRECAPSPAVRAAAAAPARDSPAGDHHTSRAAGMPTPHTAASQSAREDSAERVHAGAATGGASPSAAANLFHDQHDGGHQGRIGNHHSHALLTSHHSSRTRSHFRSHRLRAGASARGFAQSAGGWSGCRRLAHAVEHAGAEAAAPVSVAGGRAGIADESRGEYRPAARRQGLFRLRAVHVQARRRYAERRSRRRERRGSIASSSTGRMSVADTMIAPAQRLRCAVSDDAVFGCLNLLSQTVSRVPLLPSSPSCAVSSSPTSSSRASRTSRHVHSSTCTRSISTSTSTAIRAR
jgi:hypothetical protein